MKKLERELDFGKDLIYFLKSDTASMHAVQALRGLLQLLCGLLHALHVLTENDKRQS